MRLPPPRPRRSGSLQGLIGALLLLLLSREAWAVPGPELLLPMAAGTAQLLVLAGALLRQVPRHRTGRGRAGVWAAGLLLLWAALGLAGAILLGLLAAAVGGRSRLAAGLLLGAVGLALLLPPVTPPLLPALSAESAPAQPLPTSPDERLRAGGRVIVHLGEAEDFRGCVAPGGVLLRPADRHTADLSEAMVLVADRLSAKDGEGLGAWGVRPAHEVLLGSRRGAICHRVAGAMLWEALLPRRALRPRLPNPGGWSLGGAVVLRPLDAGAAPRIDALRILETSTADLPSLISSLSPDTLIEGRDPRVLAAAARLAREASMGRFPVDAVVYRRGPPVEPWPGWGARGSLTPAGLLGWLGGALLLTLVAEALVRWPGWSARRLARGLPVGGGLAWGLPLAPALILAVLLDRVPVAPSLGRLVTPAFTDELPWLGAALALAALAGVAVRLRRAPRRVRWLGWGLLGLAALLLTPHLAASQRPAALHLLPLALCWPLSALRLPLPRPEAVGWKAARLARAAAQGAPVPPMRIVRHPRQASALRRAMGGAPVLVRSSALDEDASSGTYESLPSPPLPLEEAVASVVASCGQALAMPLVAARWSAVVRLDAWSAVVEWGEGRDSVTRGAHIQGRAHLGRRSGSLTWEGIPLPGSPATLRRMIDLTADLLPDTACHAEWLGLVGDRPLLVQLHPTPPAGDPLDALRAHLADAPLGDDAVVLERIGEGSLPFPASPETLALWRDLWQAALPRTLRLLGLPRRWLSRETDAVWIAAGGLYVRTSAMAWIGQGMRLRATLGGWDPARRAAQAAQVPDEAEVVELVARSLALRFLSPWLPSPPPSTTATLPDSPSTRLARAPHEAVAMGLGHRAPQDLDPACPRYGALLPPRPTLPAPSSTRLAVAEATWLRDHLHDRLAWEVAAIRLADPARWQVASAAAAPDLAQVTLAMLERRPLSSSAADPQRTPRGVWVSGEGPLEGILSETPGPGCILLLDEAPPAAVGRGVGCVAVVARQGGMLSHAAFVARQLGVPALLGVGETAVAPGQRVRLEADGRLLAC